jgi:hypothetical protein
MPPVTLVSHMHSHNPIVAFRVWPWRLPLKLPNFQIGTSSSENDNDLVLMFCFTILSFPPFLLYLTSLSYSHTCLPLSLLTPSPIAARFQG